MAEAAQVAARRCERCETELSPTALVCPSCRRLVHAETLQSLASAARSLEARSDQAAALERWRQALALLPPGTKQHAGISAEVDRLTAALPAAPPPSTSTSAPPWVQRLGPVALLLFAGWKLVGVGKAAAFLSVLASFAVYWSAWGWAFALGFIVSLYLHELGHVVALRSAGLPASPPMFIPGVGAYVRLHARPKSLRMDAWIGLAGPVVGLLVAGAFFLAARATGSGLLRALAHVGAFINLLNLVPVWQLDGSRGFGALGRGERLLLMGLTAALLATTGERGLWLVLIPGAFRALSPKVPPRGDVPVFLVFAGLLAGLTLLADAAR
ncbi:MAG TPA: site-2 protease family protein [Myxococcaceae bacterium]|nr:site-2 protease family protein [Myxococcaceae bacterium]